MQVPPFSLSQQLVELGPDLDSAVLKVLRSGQYIGGQEVQVFEESFARSVGVPYAVGCNSGTDALILALRALEIGPGDEVITCSFSFFATAEAISAVGASPVFVDVDPVTYLIDLDQVERLITKATRAILPVHLFGNPVDMKRLMEIAKTHGLKVVEDCAQASGSKTSGQAVGSWGDVGCFSFFPTKNLGAAGDAGAITTHDSQLAQRIREIAVHGMPRRYVHTQLGLNSRLDAIQAAVLNIKLPKLVSWVERRGEIASLYQKLLRDLPGITLPFSPKGMNTIHAWNQFVIRVISCPQNDSLSNSKQHPIDISETFGTSEGGCRDWLKDSLNTYGINTIIYYPIPIHLQPAYKSLGYKSGALPVTEKLCSQVLSLPIFPEITFEQQQYVVNTLTQLLDKNTKPYSPAVALKEVEI